MKISTLFAFMLVPATLMLPDSGCAEENEVPGPPVEKLVQKPESPFFLPKDVYVAAGREANIYFDNVAPAPLPDRYLFDVTCDRGSQYTKRWSWTPESTDSGSYPFQLEVRDRDDKVLSNDATTVHVAKADAGAGKSIKLLCIGDSLTAASVYTGELLRLCSAPGNPRLTLLGTQSGGGSVLNRHEGYGGWRYVSFLSQWAPAPAAGAPPQTGPSPFLFMEGGKPVFRFNRYLAETLRGNVPDYITIMLGVNDVFSATDSDREKTVQSMVDNARLLVDAIRAAAPRARIGILPIVPPNASQDGFGDNYGSSQTRWGYCKNREMANRELIKVFGDRENENIWLVPAYVNLDCEHNFPAVETAVNARNEAKVQQASNGVHPSAPGYLQIADSIYGWLKWDLGRVR